VALESTGVYWKPVIHLLEGRCQVILGNAQHIKPVPGRKTDVKDCQWIAQLLQHGLLQVSFEPPASIRELRDLTRQRTQLIGERAAANRIQKVLEDAKIKLAGVATDVLGASGRDMLDVFIAGATDPEALADLARERLRAMIPQVRLALRGRVTEHHRFLLRLHLDHIGQQKDLIGRLGVRRAARGHGEAAVVRPLQPAHQPVGLGPRPHPGQAQLLDPAVLGHPEEALHPALRLRAVRPDQLDAQLLARPAELRRPVRTVRRRHEDTFPVRVQGQRPAVRLQPPPHSRSKCASTVSPS
jgi:hypothetical protein